MAKWFTRERRYAKKQVKFRVDTQKHADDIEVKLIGLLEKADSIEEGEIKNFKKEVDLTINEGRILSDLVKNFKQRQALLNMIGGEQQKLKSQFDDDLKKARDAFAPVQQSHEDWQGTGKFWFKDTKRKVSMGRVLARGRTLFEAIESDIEELETSFLDNIAQMRKKELQLLRRALGLTKELLDDQKSLFTNFQADRSLDRTVDDIDRALADEIRGLKFD